MQATVIQSVAGIGSGMSMLERSFDDIVMHAINESLTKIFGENTARSINFYLDPSIALTDAEAYVKGLRRMFMEGSGVIVVGICERIAQMSGLSMAGTENLGEFIKNARGRYVGQLETA